MRTNKNISNSADQKLNNEAEWTPVSENENIKERRSLLERCRHRIVEMALIGAGLFSTAPASGGTASERFNTKEDASVTVDNTSSSLKPDANDSFSLKVLDFTDMLKERCAEGMIDAEALQLSPEFFQTSNLLRKLTQMARSRASEFQNGCAAAVRKLCNECQIGKNHKLLNAKIHSTPVNPKNGRHPAFMLGQLLSENGEFYKIPVKSFEDIENAPDGALLVYNPADDSKKSTLSDGHIEVKCGKLAASDGIQQLNSAWEKTGEGKKYRDAYMLVHKSALNVDKVAERLQIMPQQEALNALYHNAEIPNEFKSIIQRTSPDLQLVPRDFQLAGVTQKIASSKKQITLKSQTLANVMMKRKRELKR